MLSAPRAWSLFEVYFSSAVKDHHERRLWIARESRLCPRSVIRGKERKREKKKGQLEKGRAPNRLANSTKSTAHQLVLLRLNVSGGDRKQHDIDSDNYRRSIRVG